MESNWRWNVWDRGLGGGGARLAACILGTGSLDFYVVDSTDDANNGQLWFLAFGQIPTMYGTLAKAGRPFPFGVPVLPD